MNESKSLLLVLFGTVISSIAVGVVFTEMVFPYIAALFGISVLVGGFFWLLLGIIIFVIGTYSFNNEVDE